MSAQTILMVEPNPGVLIVARNVLVKAGFAVLAVSNARHALKLARQRRVDLVLVEQSLASASLLAGLADTRSSSGLSVIITAAKGTRRGLEDLRTEFLAIPVDITDVLEKPFAPDRLLGAVNAATDGWNERTEPIFTDTLQALGQEVEDELGLRAETDVFPFAELLQQGEIDDVTNPAIPSRVTQLHAELRASLAREGVELDPVRIAACVRACELVLDREILRRPTVSADEDLSARKLVVTGFIGHMAVDQILQLATTVEPPARCRLESDGTAIEIFYTGHQVVFARHDNLPIGFTLGRLLVAAGHVTDRDVDRILDPRAGVSGLIGQRLLSLGHIKEPQLRDCLKRQSEELFFEVIRWSHGRFSVFSQEPMPAEAEHAGISLPVHHLLLEGMRRLDEWQRIAERVGDLHAVLNRVPEPSAERVLSLAPGDRMVLDHVDGRRTVGELLRSVARPTYDVYRAISLLTDQHLVAVAAR